MESSIQSYHVFKNLWTPTVGEQLICTWESSSTYVVMCWNTWLDPLHGDYHTVVESGVQLFLCTMMYGCLYTLSAHGFIITVYHGLDSLFSIVIFHGLPNCQNKVLSRYMGNDFKVIHSHSNRSFTKAVMFHAVNSARASCFWPFLEACDQQQNAWVPLVDRYCLIPQLPSIPLSWLLT